MIHTILKDLPTSVRGFAVEHCGDYTIILNARLSAEMNRRTYLHELDHIMHDDFGSENIDYIEAIRHGGDSCA